MRIPRRRFLQGSAVAAALTALPRIARAQAYPSRPITMIVPYAAGGPTDTVGRVVAERMRAELGQPIVLENVGGAGGSIGLGRVARAAPDGYTMNVGIWSAHVINGAIYALPYDLKTDFEPIALLAQAPHMVVAKKARRPTISKSFIAWLKANPGKTTAGTAGIGSPPHIGGVLFQNMSGTTLQFVHYRGVALATQDLVAGQIDMVDRRRHHGNAAGARRHHQGLRGGGADPAAGAAGPADRGRGRPAGLPCRDLECAVRAEGHAEGDHRAGSTPRR